MQLRLDEIKNRGLQMNSKHKILLNKIEYMFDFFYITGILVVLALLDKVGKDYIIASFMVFMLLYLFSGMALPQAFQGLIKTRIQKQQFRNVKTVFKSTLLYVLILETIVMCVTFMFLDRVIDFLSIAKPFPHGSGLFLPLLLLAPVNEVFRQYYQCYNRRITVIVSRVFGFVSALLVAFMVFRPLQEYGRKVDALLKSNCMESLYTSLTIPISLLASQVVVFLFLGWMYLVYKPYIRKQVTNDLTKYNETIPGMLPVIAKAHISANIYKISIYLLAVVAFIFCSFYNRKMAEAENVNTSFGILALVICVTIIVPYFVTKAFSLKDVVKYRKMLKNEDMRSVKAYLWNRTHKYFMMTFALAVFFIIMADSVVYILVGEVLPQYVMHMRILALSFALVPLYILYNMFLTNIGKSKSVLIINYMALVISTAITFLLYKIPAIGGYSISVGIVCYFLIAFAAEFIILEKESGFNKNIMQLFVLPLLSALVMGIILLLISKAIGIMDSRMVQFLILIGLLILCSILYMILLLVLHCVDEDELTGGMWGRIVYKLGEILHIF